MYWFFFLDRCFVYGVKTSVAIIFYGKYFENKVVGTFVVKSFI